MMLSGRTVLISVYIGYRARADGTFDQFGLLLQAIEQHTTNRRGHCTARIAAELVIAYC